MLINELDLCNPIKVYELIIHQNQNNSRIYSGKKFLKTIEGVLPPLFYNEALFQKNSGKNFGSFERFDLQ